MICMTEELLAAAAIAALAISDDKAEESTGLVETEWSDSSLLGSYSVDGGTVDIISQTAQPGSDDEGLERLAADAPAGRRYPDETRPGVLMNQPRGRKYRPSEIQKVADEWIEAIPEQGPNTPEPGPTPGRPDLPGGPVNPGGGLSDPGSFAPLVMTSNQPDLVTGRTSITRPTTTNEGRGSLTGIGKQSSTEDTNSRGETSEEFHARMSQMAEDRGATWFPTGPFDGYTAGGGGESPRTPDPETGYYPDLPPREEPKEKTPPNLSSSIQVQIDAWRNGQESCFEDVMGSGWNYRSNGNVLEATDIDFGSTPSANIALVIKTGYQIRLLVAIDRYTWDPKLSETDYIDEQYLRSGDALVTAAMFQEDEYASIPMTGGDYIQIDIDGTSEAIGDFRISSLGTEVTRSRALNDDVYIAIDPGSVSFDENRERVKPDPQPPAPVNGDDNGNGNGNGSSDRMSPLSVVLVLAALGAFIYFLVARRKGGGE